jgi:hypothetical protein
MSARLFRIQVFWGTLTVDKLGREGPLPNPAIATEVNGIFVDPCGMFAESCGQFYFRISRAD